MPDYVRVKDDTTKTELSVVVGSNLDGLTVLKGEPAVDNLSDPLPPKFLSSKSTTQSGQSAETKKES